MYSRSNWLIITFLLLVIKLNSVDYNKHKQLAIEFTKQIIKSPNNLEIIILNEKDIKMDLILENEYPKFIINQFQSIIKTQNKSDFELNSIDFHKLYDKDSSNLTINYKKKHNIFYEIFYSWLTSGCEDNVYYSYDIKDDVLYFRGVFICDHMDPNDLE
jgi:hypothetical protein